MGMGAIWRDRVYATHMPSIPDFEISTVHLEMVNIVVGLSVCAHIWLHSNIMIYCDH